MVEAVTPERFDMIRESASVADGYRRMIRFLIAGNNARAFLAGCQATKKNLDDRLAMLLEPEMTPTSPGKVQPGRNKLIPRLRTRPVSALA